MSADIAVHDISKSYRIGGQVNGTLRERIMEWATAPRRAMRASAPSIWALKDVSFGVAAGEVVGHYRPQWSGQKHPLEDPFADHPADRRKNAGARPYGFVA